jgi:HD domain-containing protein
VARADELATTDAERACLSALREATGTADDPMERHCVRQFLIAKRMAADRGIDVDPELLLCASFLHDVGLYPSVTTGDVYVTDSRRVAKRTLAPFDWQHTRLARCLDAIEQHHAQRSRWDWGAEVELIRRADLVELSRGLINFGVDRGWLRDLFREIPRRGLYHLIAASLARRDGRHPSNLARIFLPPREPTRVQDS